MAIAVEFSCKKVGLKYLAADETLEWQSGEHVETEESTGDIDDHVVIREVVLLRAMRMNV